jgi:hypothetical protein
MPTDADHGLPALGVRVDLDFAADGQRDHRVGVAEVEVGDNG